MQPLTMEQDFSSQVKRGQQMDVNSWKKKILQLMTPNNKKKGTIVYRMNTESLTSKYLIQW